uniref:Uncharacterized protein n=1 Tax=Oryza glumipatula TaxID=40148 RepID=A0A0E0A4K2_9ORYZ
MQFLTISSYAGVPTTLMARFRVAATFFTSLGSTTLHCQKNHITSNHAYVDAETAHVETSLAFDDRVHEPTGGRASTGLEKSTRKIIMHLHCIAQR